MPKVRLIHLIVAIAVAAALVPLIRLMDGPSFVERISFENPTEYHLRVEVSGFRRDGWTAIGTLQRNATTVTEEVHDVGEGWVFRFFAQGEEGGELSVPRSQLERDDWLVSIPERIGDELRGKGAPPPP